MRDYDNPMTHSAGDGFQELNEVARKAAAFSKYIHAVILVLKADDPRLEDGVYRGTLQRITDYFHTHGNNDINHKNYSFLDCDWLVIGQFKKPIIFKVVFKSTIHI